MQLLPFIPICCFHYSPTAAADFAVLDWLVMVEAYCKIWSNNRFLFVLTSTMPVVCSLDKMTR